MAKPLYQIVTLDLAVARSGIVIPSVDIGARFDAITVLQLPGGSVISLAFGASGAFIPLLTAGQTFRFLDACEHPFFCDEGLFVQNAAGAGSVILLVSQGTSPDIAT